MTRTSEFHLRQVNAFDPGRGCPDDRHSVAFVEHLASGAGLFRCVHCTTECVLEPDGSWVPVEGSAG